MATEWPEVQGFRSPDEFDRLVDALEAADNVTEIPVGDAYSGSSMFVERWFRLGDRSTWRLVAPDPPFTGVFEPVGRA